MEINGKNAIVAFGSIKTTVKIDRLERSNAPQKTEGIAKSTFVSSQTHNQMYEKKLSFKQDIDCLLYTSGLFYGYYIFWFCIDIHNFKHFNAPESITGS